MSGLIGVIFYLVAACHDDDEYFSGIQFASSNLMGPTGITRDKDSMEKDMQQSLARGGTRWEGQFAKCLIALTYKCRKFATKRLMRNVQIRNLTECIFYVVHVGLMF